MKPTLHPSQVLARRALEACLALAFFSTLNFRLSTVFAQGSLTPPGAPAPTMKTLAQIEPRTPISALPFTITNSGSYYVTSNLTAGFDNGIVIATNEVTIDLQGFTLNGAGIGFTGILVSGNRTNITARNGNVSGWISYGIDARTCYIGRFDSLHLTRNNTAGLACGRRGYVQNCLSFSNVQDGFYVGGETMVQNCVAGYNGQHGMNFFEGGNRADNNHVLRNTGYGLYFPNGGSLVIRNSAQGNGTNYNIFSFNTFGPTTVGTGITTNHPWANFSF